MSNSMGIASAFILSSLFLSPLAMAEESQAFVARNAARDAAFQDAQVAQATRQKTGESAQKITAKHNQADTRKDS